MHRDRKIAAGLFALSFLAAGWFFNGGGWNQNAIFDLTRAVVERQTFWIDGYQVNTGDVAWAGEHTYANKPPGLSFLAALPYAILFHAERAAGADPEAFKFLTINAYVCSLFTCALSGALIPVLLFRYARRRLELSAAWALGVALTVALGTPLLSYSTLLYVHVPSALLTLVCFLAVDSEGRSTREAAAGAAAGLNVLCNYLAIPLLVIFAVALIWKRDRKTRRLLIYLAAAAPALALFCWYQLSAFGSVFQNPANLNPMFLSDGGLLSMPRLDAVIGVTVSPYRGLLFLSPILILALPGIMRLYRQRPRHVSLLLFSLLAVFLGFNLTFDNWHGGWGIGPRYLIPIVPLLGVAMLHVAGKWPALWLTLGSLSLLNNLAAVTVDPQVPTTVRNPLRDYIYPLLVRGRLDPEVPVIPAWANPHLRGHTSVGRQGIDEMLPLSRHAPGSVEAEWASFNLGELLTGPGDLLSVLPLLVAVATLAVLLLRLARREKLPHSSRRREKAEKG